MAVSSARRTVEPEIAPGRLALAVADANWFTTENLFQELDRPGIATLLLKCIDYYNAWKQGGRPWDWGRALTERGPNLWQRELVLPSGWMKQFPSLGMRPIRKSIAQWRELHAPDSPLTLVMTYPHYLYLRDLVRPDHHVYFNIDDYSQYWPRCADRVNELERQAVRESDLTVCVSKLRSEQLRQAVPEAAHKVRHLPHGAPSPSLGRKPHRTPAEPPKDIAHLPGPRFGYVGSLEDRIDWPLLTKLADAFPHGSVILIGNAHDAASPGAWEFDRKRCLARPNVKALGWRPQETIARYNASFDACLIPYRADHPFNQVCCPTKIMDYMGTGRPILASDLPECRLYGDLFDVAADAEQFVEFARGLERRKFDDDRADLRHEFASQNTCRRVVERFLDWLPPTR